MTVHVSWIFYFWLTIGQLISRSKELGDITVEGSGEDPLILVGTDNFLSNITELPEEQLPEVRLEPIPKESQNDDVKPDTISTGAEVPETNWNGSTNPIDQLELTNVQQSTPSRQIKDDKRIGADEEKINGLYTELSEKFDTGTDRRQNNDTDGSNDRKASNTNQASCPADIVFMLDASGSLEQTFSQHISWSKQLVEMLLSDPNRIHIGLIQYADTPKTEFYLNTYGNRKEIIDHISRINFRSGGTRTGKALKQAEVVLFDKNRGSRATAKKLLILFTDGLSIDDPLKHAHNLREDRGTKIYVISVGSDGFQPEMNRIAGEKSKVFGPNDYSKLQKTLIDEIMTERCESSAAPSKVRKTVQSLVTQIANAGQSKAASLSISQTISTNQHLNTVRTRSTTPPSLSQPTTLTPQRKPSRKNIITKGKVTRISKSETQKKVPQGTKIAAASFPVTNDVQFFRDLQTAQPTSNDDRNISNEINEIISIDNDSLKVESKDYLIYNEKEGTESNQLVKSNQNVAESVVSSAKTDDILENDNSENITKSFSLELSDPEATIENAISNVSKEIVNQLEEQQDQKSSIKAVETKEAETSSSKAIIENVIESLEGLERAASNEISELEGLADEELGIGATTIPTSTLKQSKKLPQTSPQDVILTRTTRISITTSSSGAVKKNNQKNRSQSATKLGHCPREILVILDSSGSVQTIYEQQKEYLEALLNELQIGQEEQRVALTQFAGSTHQRVEWNFDTFNELKPMLNALTQVRHITGTTFIGRALENSLRLLGTRRDGIPSVIILISDGFSQDDASKPAEEIRRLPNVDFYAVSISALNNFDYLSKLTDDPSKVFVAERSNELKMNLQKLLHCRS